VFVAKVFNTKKDYSEIRSTKCNVLVTVYATLLSEQRFHVATQSSDVRSSFSFTGN